MQYVAICQDLQYSPLSVFTHTIALFIRYQITGGFFLAHYVFLIVLWFGFFPKHRRPFPRIVLPVISADTEPWVTLQSINYHPEDEGERRTERGEADRGEWPWPDAVRGLRMVERGGSGREGRKAEGWEGWGGGVGAERTSVQQQWLGNQISQSQQQEGRREEAEPRSPLGHSQSFKALSSANSPWTLLESGSDVWRTRLPEPSLGPAIQDPTPSVSEALPGRAVSWRVPTSGGLTHNIPSEICTFGKYNSVYLSKTNANYMSFFLSLAAVAEVML